MPATADVIYVAITFADDSVGVMQFVTRQKDGQGNTVWTRPATADVVEAEIAKSVFDPHLRPIKRWTPVNHHDIPADRSYRNAWRHGPDGFWHDMDHAQRIHVERVRQARQPVLDQLDREWHRATGQGRQQDADAIEAQRQRLRDLPSTMDLKHAHTIEELQALWPVELPR